MKKYICSILALLSIFLCFSSCLVDVESFDDSIYFKNKLEETYQDTFTFVKKEKINSNTYYFYYESEVLQQEVIARKITTKKSFLSEQFTESTNYDQVYFKNDLYEFVTNQLKDFFNKDSIKISSEGVIFNRFYDYKDDFKNYMSWLNYDTETKNEFSNNNFNFLLSIKYSSDINDYEQVTKALCSAIKGIYLPIKLYFFSETFGDYSSVDKAYKLVYKDNASYPFNYTYTKL